MRAVVLESYGEPDVLTIRDVPDPRPGPEEVVVDIVATALNRADLLQRRGFYPGPPMEHEIPGMELSGTVREVGERVTLWSPGDEVMGIVGGGAYAEQIAVHERQLMRVPVAVGVADAAAIPEVWITAFDALVAQGGLTSGRTALVHAGGSGVGTAAIQIAKAYGAQVIVTASAGKIARCLELGADAAVDYAVDDYVAVTHELTGGRGADVVLDVIGGDYVERNIDAVAVQGRIILVGVMGGGVTSVNVGKLLPKRAAIIGTVLRGRPIEEKIAITRRFATELLPRFESGDVAPVIDRRYPLDAIAAAHQAMEANENVGKIVIDVSAARTP
ncbi:MAG: NAD(P)H-quinone oxidoreductase [Acidimicrobiales bacterium]